MKYVIVTGAYGGMGYAAVRAFKNDGYFVFALDRQVKEAEVDGMRATEILVVEECTTADSILKGDSIWAGVLATVKRL